MSSTRLAPLHLPASIRQTQPERRGHTAKRRSQRAFPELILPTPNLTVPHQRCRGRHGIQHQPLGMRVTQEMLVGGPADGAQADALRQLQGFTVEATGAPQIAIGNGRHYGGGVVVHSDATIHDGMLDLYSLELETLWKLALNFRAFQRGEHTGWDDVRVDHAESFEIETRSPQPVNADGEVVTQTPVKLQVLKQALQVFGP